MDNSPLNRRDLLALGGMASLCPLLAAETRTMPASPQSPGDRRRELYATLGNLSDRKRPLEGVSRDDPDVITRFGQ